MSNIVDNVTIPSTRHTTKCQTDTRKQWIVTSI